MKKHTPSLKRENHIIFVIGNKLKNIVIVATLPLLFAVPNVVKADDLNSVNAQINNLSNQIQQKRNEKDSIENEIAILDAQVQQLDLQIQATNTEITNLTASINDTNNQIAQKEVELKAENDKMAEYLAIMYEDDQTSMVELLAKSNTFSDFVDRKEYLSSIQLKIKEVADRIVAIKKELEAKKKALDEQKVKTEELQKAQLAQKQAQEQQKAYKNQLLAEIRNQEAGMQSKLNDLHARKAALSVVYNERISTSVSAAPAGGGSYPYGNPPPRYLIDTPDPWGYLIGECTGYVAWKRASTGRPVPYGLGNANTWGYRAAAMGYSVSSSPRAGDVMVMPYLGGYGHVAYVEAVYGNGTVLISEYNWVPFSYSSRVVNPWNYGAQFIH